MIGDVVLKLDGPAHDEVKRLFAVASDMLNTIEHLSQKMGEMERRAWRAIRELAGDAMRMDERIYSYDRRAGTIVDIGPFDRARFLAQDNK